MEKAMSNLQSLDNESIAVVGNTVSRINIWRAIDRIQAVKHKGWLPKPKYKLALFGRAVATKEFSKSNRFKKPNYYQEVIMLKDIWEL